MLSIALVAIDCVAWIVTAGSQREEYVEKRSNAVALAIGQSLRIKELVVNYRRRVLSALM